MTKVAGKTPFNVYAQILGGDPDPVEMKIRAKRMGYNLEGNRLTNSQSGEQYSFDPDSVTAYLARSGRDAARLAGGLAGGAAGMAVGPAGAAGGGVAGSMMAGSAWDLAMGDQEDPLEQFARDTGEEAFGLMGGKAVDAVSPYIRAGAQKGYAVLNDGIKTVKDRILNEQPAGVILNPREEISQLLDAVATGKTKLIDADPDPEILRAAERMGMVLQPDQVSRNPQFIEVMQALKSGQASTLRKEEIEVLGELQTQVDDLMTDAGNVDVAGLSDDLLARWQKTEGALAKADSMIRDRIKPEKGVKWKPLSILDGIEDKRVDGPLTGIWKKVDGMLKASDYETTYQYLDRIRRSIGEAYKGRGEFGDASTFELDEVYKALSEDQFRIARVLGFDKELALANKVTQAKKGLQERMVTAFGNDLGKTMTASLSNAVTRATKGDLTSWRKMMKTVPAKYRPEVAGASVQYLITGGKGRITRGFVDRYEMLMKNKTAQKELMEYLPGHVVDRLEDLYQVSKGIYRSLDQKNNSRTARDLIINMDLEKGWVSRLARTATTTAGNAVKPGAGTVLGMFSPEPKTFSKEAEMMLGSPKFKAVMEAGIKERNLKQAEKALMSTPLYKRWEQLQDAAVKDSIAAQGLFRYLMPEYQ